MHSTRHLHLAEAFDEILVKSGFRSEAKQEREPDWLTWRWSRLPNRWRSDEIELLVNRPRSTRALANLRVHLRAGDSLLRLDGCSFTGLVSDGRAIDLASGFFGGLGWKRRLERIRHDLVKALGWFEQYGTPSACTALIEAGRANLGKGEAQRALELLQQLARDPDLADPGTSGGAQ
jgi:hypothetical protein